LGFKGCAHVCIACRHGRRVAVGGCEKRGQSDARMVEKHYGHLAPSYMAEEIRKKTLRFGFKPIRSWLCWEADMAKTNGAVTDIDEDWYGEPSPDLDVEWVHGRAAELGPEFAKVVDAVMGEMRCGERDSVSAWLINCVDRFAAQDKIEPAKVRDWALKVGKTAASLARLLESESKLFPEGTAQSEFSFYHEGFELPSADGIAHLWKMTEAAQAIATAWRRKGAPKRHHREDLLLTLSYGYEDFTSKPANLGKSFLAVVKAVFDFIGESREKSSIHGAVNRMLKARKRRHAGIKKGQVFS
jgi:hypothetical protein